MYAGVQTALDGYYFLCNLKLVTPWKNPNWACACVGSNAQKRDRKTIDRQMK